MFKALFTFKICLLLAVFGVQAQTAPAISEKKIAIVNQDLFYYEGYGITQLLEAYHSQDKKDCVVNKTPGQNGLCESALTASTKKAITAELAKVARENNLEIIDLKKYEMATQLLFASGKIDITQTFIKYFNASEDTETRLQVTLPVAKIFVIDTREFRNERTGIRGLTDFGSICGEIKKDCIPDTSRKLGSFIASFAEARDAVLVLDSRIPLPEEIKQFKVTDVTREVISTFNKTNK